MCLIVTKKKKKVYYFLLPPFSFSLPSFTHSENETLFKLSYFNRMFLMLCLILLTIFLITYKHLFVKIWFSTVLSCYKNYNCTIDHSIHLIYSKYLINSSTIQQCESVLYQYFEGLSWRNKKYNNIIVTAKIWLFQYGINYINILLAKACVSRNLTPKNRIRTEGFVCARMSKFL